MKKLITILAVAIAIPTMVKAQGTVLFTSKSAAQVIQQNNVSVAPGFANVALYYGTTSVSNSLTLIGAVIQNGAGGGISGGTRTTGADVPGGATAFFQVRSWTGAFASYEAAYASQTGGLGGTSAIFSNTTGNPLSAPPGTPADLTGWTSAVQLVALPVPEPSTIALGILGAGSLLFIRRKK